MKYMTRALAAGYVFGWSIWAISMIGKPASGNPVTSWSAWNFIAMLVVAVWLGWIAGKESDSYK